MKPTSPYITYDTTVHLTDTEPDRRTAIMHGIDPDDPQAKEKVSMIPRPNGGRDATTRIL
ncbi:hypothetical protein JS532_08445 [Bifidobacterium callimiconis]|uniref:hypothetical protein n=1 Tax=Bifidobacterium callimiconis TaxID=2306973 RepID=UPI001BDBC89C|nr:hypothetical protein [Bifidobacterium callimiconis]MBT1177589.1 hypothetical protein [Bifidobacterium callimiconis]